MSNKMTKPPPTKVKRRVGKCQSSASPIYLPVHPPVPIYLSCEISLQYFTWDRDSVSELEENESAYRSLLLLGASGDSIGLII